MFPEVRPSQIAQETPPLSEVKALTLFDFVTKQANGLLSHESLKGVLVAAEAVRVVPLSEYVPPRTFTPMIWAFTTNPESARDAKILVECEQAVHPLKVRLFYFPVNELAPKTHELTGEPMTFIERAMRSRINTIISSAAFERINGIGITETKRGDPAIIIMIPTKYRFDRSFRARLEESAAPFSVVIQWERGMAVALDKKSLVRSKEVAEPIAAGT